LTCTAPIRRGIAARAINILEHAKNWVDPLLASLNQDPAFADIVDRVTKICGGPIYLVGGQIYRRLANIIHGIDTPVERDWDFLCLGMPRYGEEIFTEDEEEEWEEDYSRGFFSSRFRYYYYPYRRRRRWWYRPYSWYDDDYDYYDYYYDRRNPTPEQLQKRVENKVDVISIYDSNQILGGKDSTVTELIQNKEYEKLVNIYFDSVPLDIQAIALDLTNERLMGVQGLSAVFNKEIWLKRPENLEKWNIDPQSYLKGKLKSLPGFKENKKPPVSAQPKPRQHYRRHNPYRIRRRFGRWHQRYG
jgi:hypothetical protein